MLVIFDCDGVLVESEALVAKVYAQELQQLGHGISAAECEALLIGKTTPHCLATLEAHLCTLLPSDFMLRVDAAAEALFEHEMQPIPGVETVLQHLQALNRPLCVCSNGSPQKIENSLRRCGLGQYFLPYVFSGYSVPSPKPAPDVYLLAAQRMGFLAHQCTVIEDSEVGMTAALAAQMKVFLYRPPHRPIHFKPPACVTVFSDMRQLIVAI